MSYEVTGEVYIYVLVSACDVMNGKNVMSKVVNNITICLLRNTGNNALLCEYRAPKTVSKHFKMQHHQQFNPVVSRRQDKKPVHHFLLASSSQGSNELNQNLLERITKSKKIHMVPCQLAGRFVLRFAICARSTESRHIQRAWQHITQLTFELLQEPSHWPICLKRGCPLWCSSEDPS